jgi:hypothetical protein
MELMVVRPITSLKRIESSKIIIVKGVTYATCHQKYQLGAALLPLSMWPCKRKLHDKKSKHAGFAQLNGFGLSVLHMMLPPLKDTV